MLEGRFGIHNNSMILFNSWKEYYLEKLSILKWIRLSLSYHSLLRNCRRPVKFSIDGFILSNVQLIKDTTNKHFDVNSPIMIACARQVAPDYSEVIFWNP